MQASVARCLRTPPYAAKRKDLVSATRTAYAAKAIAGARLSFATVRFGPITVVPHRAKAGPFRRSSILFRPRPPQMKGSVGGVAGYRPRVRAVYYGCVYRHSLSYPRRHQYKPSFAVAQATAGPAKRKSPKAGLWAISDRFRPDQKPDLMVSNSCTIRSRISPEIGTCASKVVSIGFTSAAIRAAGSIEAIEASLVWA